MKFANKKNLLNIEDSYWAFKVKEEETDELISPKIEVPLFEANSLALTKSIETSDALALLPSPDWEPAFNLDKEYRSPLHLVSVGDQGLLSPLSSPKTDTYFDEIDLIRESIASLDGPNLSSQAIQPQPIQRATDDDDDDDDPTFQLESEHDTFQSGSRRYFEARRPGPKPGRPRAQRGRPSGQRMAVQKPSSAPSLSSRTSFQPNRRIVAQLQRSSSSCELYNTIELPPSSYACSSQGAQAGTFNFFNLRKKGAWRRK